MQSKFTLQEAQAHAPLVRAILRDICSQHASLYHQNQRLDLLHECRHSPRYDVRRQFYATQRQVTATEKVLEELMDELDLLGLTLLDPVRGVAGFPFRLTSAKKDRRTSAFFLIKLSDDPEQGLRTWQREGEDTEHQIPQLWHEKEVSVSTSETDTPVF